MTVPVRKFATFFKGGRLAVQSGESLLPAEESRMIALSTDSLSRFASALERLAEVAERLGPRETVNESPAPKTLSIADASKELRLHPQTTTKLCREGRITATKTYGKWYIPRQEIDRILRRYEVVNGKKKGGA